MPVLKKHFSISPLNDNPMNILAASVISGGFSHRDGFPTIRFSLPSQMALLETSTLHLTGQFVVKKTEDNTIFDDAIVANDNLDNGVNMTRATGTNIPNWGGVKNVIDKVVVQSKKSQVELTSAINYAQYEGLMECYTHNKEDYLESPLTRALSSGANADNCNRRLLRSADPATITNMPGGANSKSIGVPFSIRLNLDLLNNLPLHLGNDYTGGLLITVHLNPDSQVFCNRFRSFLVAQVAQANAAAQASYVLKNVKLEGRYVIPTAQELASYPDQVMLNSRLNLINDIQASVNSNSYTPQLQMVKGIINLYLDNDQVNNVNQNANNFRHPVGEKANQQAKNGLRYPYDYKTIAKPDFDSAVENGTLANGINPPTMTVPTNQIGDCEIRHQFQHALLGGKEPYHSSATIEQQNASLGEDQQVYGNGAVLTNNNLIPNCVGIGADYTFNMGNVQNFVNQDYNLTVESGVNTGNAKLPALRNGGGAAANPLLQQSFLKHFSPFNLRTLVKTM
jgi:hypothetical protein